MPLYANDLRVGAIITNEEDLFIIRGFEKNENSFAVTLSREDLSGGFRAFEFTETYRNERGARHLRPYSRVVKKL